MCNGITSSEADNLNVTQRIKRIRILFCLSAFFVFLGGLAIYVFFRNLNIAIFQFIPKPLFLDTLHVSLKTDNILVSMFLYNLPDGLWFLSGILVIRAIWLTNQKWRLIYFCVFSFIALTMEIIQIFKSIPGTFDLLDIAFMAFFAFVESIIFYKFVKGRILL